jgi:inner membrane protein
VDVFGSFAGNMLSFRRGWTHGVLAMLLLPVLLAALLWLWHRRFPRAEPAARPDRLLLLAAIAVWSHPLLDLLNTYGVRLLMPFSARWYYGDALFIVDPWGWGLLLLGILASRRLANRNNPRWALPARGALLAFAGYAAAMALGSRLAAGAAERETAGPVALRVLAGPRFGRPFEREVIRELPDGSYELGRAVLGSRWHYRATLRIARGEQDPAAQAAARTPEGAAFLRWARFPRFETGPQRGAGVPVRLSDVRYGGARGQSWASVTVLVRRGPAGPR